MSSTYRNQSGIVSRQFGKAPFAKCCITFSATTTETGDPMAVVTSLFVEVFTFITLKNHKIQLLNREQQLWQPSASSDCQCLWLHELGARVNAKREWVSAGR